MAFQANTEHSKVSITQKTDSYKEVKSRLRDSALKSAVSWAKAEKMLDGQEKVVNFEKDYMFQVLEVAFSGINSGDWAEQSILTKFGKTDTLRGKPVEVDGQPYQPTVCFRPNNDYVDEEGNPVTDLAVIGKHRLCKLAESYEEKVDESIMLKQQRKLLRWKQKFHRYCYNFNDTEMTKYHDKISEFDSSFLDARCEANAEGREITVIQHHCDESNEDGSMDSGYKTQQRGLDNKTIDNGGSMKLYADKMKEAYDIRVSTIQTVKIMLRIPVEQRKLVKLPTIYTELRSTNADAPTLI